MKTLLKVTRDRDGRLSFESDFPTEMEEVDAFELMFYLKLGMMDHLRGKEERALIKTVRSLYLGTLLIAKDPKREMKRIWEKMMRIFPFFEEMQDKMLASGLLRPDPADRKQPYS
jgi:hypothetical protein